MAVSTAEMIGRVLGKPKSPLVNQMIQQPQTAPALPAAPLTNPTAWGGSDVITQTPTTSGPATQFPAAPRTNPTAPPATRGGSDVIYNPPTTSGPATQFPSAPRTNPAPAWGGGSDVVSNAQFQQYAQQGNTGQQGSGFSGAPMAPQSPPTTTSSSPLVQQLMGQQSGATGNPQTTAEFFAGAGLALPPEIPAGTPAADSYMKSRLLSMGSANPQMGPAQTAAPQLQPASGGNRVTLGQPQQGLPGSGMNVPGMGMQPGQQQGGLAGTLQGGLGGQPSNPMAGIPPELLQALTASLSGQGAPQAAAPPPTDPALMQAIQNQLNGVGQPTFQDIVQGTFEPMSALMDQQFQTAQTQAFEQLISRGVLQSGETQNTITRMAQDLGMSKGALLGNLALDYSKQRNEQITNAISQWGILENNRATNAVTISAANLQAAVSVQNVAMQTLTSLTTAMAQIQSAEKIAGADISSREKIAGQQIAAQTQIAGMDIASRQQIAAMQTQMQQTVAQISAQAMLQAANFDKQTAHDNVTAQMALQGIDWNRFLSDPEYAQNMTNAIAIERDIHLAIDQADAVNRQLPTVRE